MKRGGASRSKVGTGTTPGTTTVTGNSSPAAGAVPTVDKDQKYRTTATLCVGMFLNFNIGCFGEEYIPVALDEKGLITERALLEDAAYEYCKAHDLSDIPPGMYVTLAVGMYYTKRFQMPKTKEKVKGIWAGIKRWWADYKYRRAESKKDKSNKEHATADAKMRNGSTALPPTRAEMGA